MLLHAWIDFLRDEIKKSLMLQILASLSSLPTAGGASIGSGFQGKDAMRRVCSGRI